MSSEKIIFHGWSLQNLWPTPQKSLKNIYLYFLRCQDRVLGLQRVALENRFWIIGGMIRNSLGELVGPKLHCGMLEQWTKAWIQRQLVKKSWEEAGSWEPRSIAGKEFVISKSYEKNSWYQHLMDDPMRLNWLDSEARSGSGEAGRANAGTGCPCWISHGCAKTAL